jgi:outer membrane protein OmpA-like peptidoglycan-associated protein
LVLSVINGKLIRRLWLIGIDMRYKYISLILVSAALVPAQGSASGDQLPKQAAQLDPPRMMLPSRGTIHAADVFFQIGKADLTPDEIAKLNALAPKVRLELLEAVILMGFSDSQGKEANNQKLSGQRAEAVKLFFMSRGFPSRSIHIEGKGTAYPAATNDTAKGRASNRRVEVEIQEWRGFNEDLRRMQPKNQAVQSKETADDKLNTEVTK